MIVAAVLTVFTAEGAELTGDALFESVLNGVGAHGCKEGGVFRTCLSLKEQQCNAILRSAAHMCLQRMSEEIPKVITNRDDAEKWGARIATCIASVTANANSDLLNEREAICTSLKNRDAGK
jgi:hypothetical protein